MMNDVAVSFKKGLAAKINRQPTIIEDKSQ